MKDTKHIGNTPVFPKISYSTGETEELIKATRKSAEESRGNSPV